MCSSPYSTVLFFCNGSPSVFSLCFWFPFLVCVHSSLSSGFTKGGICVCVLLQGYCGKGRMNAVLYHIQSGGPQPLLSNLFLFCHKVWFSTLLVLPRIGCFLLRFWPSSGFQARSDSLSPEGFTLTISLCFSIVLIVHTRCSKYCLTWHHLLTCRYASLTT